MPNDLKILMSSHLMVELVKTPVRAHFSLRHISKILLILGGKIISLDRKYERIRLSNLRVFDSELTRKAIERQS